MIKTAYTCNALRTKHFFRFLWVWIRSYKPLKLLADCKEEIARYFDVDPDSVFLFGAARMGLYSLLISDRSEDKDEVIVAGYTCVVVTNAIKYAGLNAIYIDVEEENLNIDPDLLRNAINEKTKAIIFTHNYGITCEYIGEFKAAYPDIMIIEDAAHTFGSVDRQGRKAGTLGDASFFSLEYSKSLTTGTGGIILVNDQDLRKRLAVFYNKLPTYPWITNFRIIVSLKAHLFSSSRYTAFLKKWMTAALYLTGLLFKAPPRELQGEMPGHYPVKLSPYLAYMVYLQIRDIEETNHIKDSLCHKYYKNLEGIAGIRQYYSDRFNFVRYPVLFEPDVSMEIVNSIKTEMKRSGIVPGEWFNDVVHPRGSLRYCYIDGSCPIGESVSKRMINLPVTVHTQLKERDLNRIREIFVKHLS